MPSSPAISIGGRKIETYCTCKNMQAEAQREPQPGTNDGILKCSLHVPTGSISEADVVRDEGGEGDSQRSVRRWRIWLKRKLLVK